MISILISTYNYDCSQLLHDLNAQCRILKRTVGASCFDFEIILGDDASSDSVAEQTNHLACSAMGCRYLKNNENTGQATLRNKLASEAKFPYLLFIDSDAAVCTDDFVKMYWKHRDDAQVVVGSIWNPDLTDKRGRELRYRYETAAMSKRSVEARRKHPYSFISAFNLLIHRDAFMAVRFEGHCRYYGYEDAFFGLELQRKGVSIAHIDNPLVHLGIDTSRSFLCKTETALRTLSTMDALMQREAGPSKWHARFQRLHVAGLVAGSFLLLRPLMRWNLLSSRPSLFLFNVYKLGYYCALAKGWI